jgi:signal transduction histidine kinase
MMLGEQLPRGEASPHDGLVRGIAKGLDRLREIVDDLIDVSALETNMVSLSYQPVRLSRVFDRVKSELAGVLAARRLTMVVDEFDNEATLTQADPQRMLQVARKVVGNAVKYTPDGGCITVSARPLPAFVEVLVADSGIGIAPEQVQGIFEKFGQAGDVALHSTGKTKFKGGGTGLSLHIVKGILERHGGSIWCESPGHDERTCPGSTFHLLIPLRDGPPPP